MKPNDFKVGQIIKMAPGWYTENEYYIEVVFVAENFIVTNIPKHSAHVFDYRDLGTWEVQTKRMTIMGDKSDFGHLLDTEIIRKAR